MSQWQFKLFEFDIKDELDNTTEFVKGRDNKQFIVQMFGIDTEGKTACIFARGFQPFFYVKVGEDWTNTEMLEFVAELRKKLGDYYGESLTKSKIIHKQKLYGFDNKKLHTFIQLKFKNMPALNKAKNLWYKDTNINGKFERKMRPEGILFKEINTELYEAQIPPLLRLFHIREISPSGWIAMTPGTYITHKKKTTTCDYEFSINYRQIKPIHQKETRVPYKILSFDIEASSSHGDFPLAKKNYKKLAMNIYELTRTTITENIKLLTKDWIKRCIDTAFGYDNLKGIEVIYPKKKTNQEELTAYFEEWIVVCPAAYNMMIKDEFINRLEEEEKEKEKGEEEEDDDELEEGPIEIVVENFGFRPIIKRIKKYTKKEATVLDLLNDVECERDTKIQELTKTLDLYFPEIEGDCVTFIGSSLRKDGEEKPYLKHCIVVNTCDPVDNAVIESYPTEKDALVAWTEFVQKENPDIIIGYNIHGWDCNFMFERSQELGCTTKFLMLSRNKNEVCINKDWKTNKLGIEQNSLFIASGQFDIKYFKMAGRLQIDFLNLFRREHQLSSYKLDYVAGYFIGDMITKVENLEDNLKHITIIHSKNLTGLDVGDYIVIEEIGHTTNMYLNGQKFMIKSKNKNSFELEGHVTPDTTKSLRWSLGKDDVTPQDIFRLTNQGPAERAIVAKYCIKDTTLVQDLMRKVDTVTGFIEMSKICSVPMSFLVMRGQGIKLTSFVAKKCREKNTLMPVIEKSLDDDGYEGAIVLPPKCNLYLDDPVACVDYSSLYPSSIISENLSHDSKVWTKEYDLAGNLLKDWGVKSETTINLESESNYIYDNLTGYKYVDVTYDTFRWIRKTPKGAAIKECVGYKTCRFIQFNEGKAILPSILEELLAARKATRALMKHEKDPFMVNIYDNRQLAIKVTANSLYGQCGAKTSTFFEKDVAASTTAIGRKLLIYAKTVIETAYDNTTEETKNHGNVKVKGEYIYGDTDSVFFTFNLRDENDIKIIGKKALEITIDLAQKAGALATKFLKKPHDLEYEKTFMPFCLLSKKRYVGMLYEFDANKCKRKSMGIVLKRRDNAPIVKDIYGGVIDILMNEKKVFKAVDYVKECLQNVVDEKYPREKLIVTKSLRSNYKNPGQIAHNVLANRIGEREPGNKPGPGDRIPFIYIKNANKKALQGEKIENPKYILEHNLHIDYGFYITNQIMKPLQQLFALVLEQMTDFKTVRGKSQSWKTDIEKLHIKWTNEEKYNKKYEEFRCKEVKTLLFDPYIKQLK